METPGNRPGERRNDATLIRSRLSTKLCTGPQRVNLHGDDHMANITGTNGDDVLNGTEKNDVIVGLDGNDVLNGKGGKDVLVGNRGADKHNGGHGDDTIVWNNG